MFAYVTNFTCSTYSDHHSKILRNRRSEENYLTQIYVKTKERKTIARERRRKICSLRKVIGTEATTASQGWFIRCTFRCDWKRQLTQLTKHSHRLGDNREQNKNSRHLKSKSSLRERSIQMIDWCIINFWEITLPIECDMSFFCLFVHVYHESSSNYKTNIVDFVWGDVNKVRTTGESISGEL